MVILYFVAVLVVFFFGFFCCRCCFLGVGGVGVGMDVALAPCVPW